MSRFRDDREDVEFEAKIEHATSKAYLIELTLGGRYWLPKSQVRHMGEPDIDGNREFAVSDWWWGVKNEAE